MKMEKKDCFYELISIFAKHYKPKLFHSNYFNSSGPIDFDEYFGPSDQMSQ